MPSLQALKALKARISPSKHQDNSQEVKNDTYPRQNVDVICIPVDGSTIRIKKVPIRDRTFEPVSNEFALFRVPYPPESGDWRAEEWKDRMLVNLGDMDPDQTSPEGFGPYLMYISSRTKALTKNDMQNRNFEKAGCVRPIYGNAFIFRLWSPTDFGSERSDGFIDLDESFVGSALGGMGISGHKILKWLAAQKSDEDQAYGYVETNAEVSVD